MALGKLVNRKVIFGLIIIAGLGAMYLPGYIKIQEMKARDRRLREEIESLSRDNLDMAQELNKLKNDPVYAEYVARREMGYAGDGEIIYRVIEDDNAPSPEDE